MGTKWLAAVRVVAAAAIAIGGYAHFDLYHSAGYKHAPVGTMFLLDFIASCVIALMVLIGPRRIGAFLGLGVSFMTLLAFVLSRGPGVPTFSGVTFKESGLSPQSVHLFGVEIALVVIIVESIGIVLCTLLFVVRAERASTLRIGRRHSLGAR